MAVMLTLSYKKSHSAFAHRKAPEGWRTPKRFAYFRNHRVAHSVMDCGGPPPLFPKPHSIVPILPQSPLNISLLTELVLPLDFELQRCRTYGAEKSAAFAGTGCGS